MLSTIRRHRLMAMATATVLGGEHGMAARLVTPYRAVIVPPIKAPRRGNWRTWNGCPPGYTIQGGICQPYRGH